MSLAPSRLEYAHAFDLAAARWGDGPALAVVSTPEFVDLAIARAWGGVLLWCEDDTTLAHARARLAAGYLLPTAQAQSGAWPAGDPDSQRFWNLVRYVVWAAPQTDTWGARLTAIERAVSNGAQLAVLAATPVGAVLHPLRRGAARGEPAAIAPLRARLAAGAWRLDEETHIGGLDGVLWAVAARLAARAGRPDLADRCERAHHATVSSVFASSFRLTRATRHSGKDTQ